MASAEQSRFTDLKYLSRELFFRLTADGIQVEGQKHIPLHGPAIIAFNHMAWAEALVPLFLLPELPVTMTKTENFRNPVFGSALRALGFTPVKRGKSDRSAIATSIQALVEHKFFATSPEGTRGKDILGNRHEMKIAHPGIIYIAKKAANILQKPIPISPWAIWGGTEWILPDIDDSSLGLRQRLIYQHEPVYVRIAQSFLVQPPIKEEELRSANLQPCADAVMMAIRDMLPAQYHGYYRNLTPIAVPGESL